MSYDNWKLSNPQDDGWTSHEVTSCCGVEQEGSGTSNCCDARFWAETYTTALNAVKIITLTK